MICFGNFEVNLEAGELLRAGISVRLPRQPFEVLAALLARPGDVVTRKDLRQKIWPSHTFVDFERGINKAVNRLRDALDDCAEAPQYVQTIAGRGYRFIAPVERRICSIAVLPFENLCGDSAQDYWAYGITDDLISGLARISGLKVTSRTSVMRFKDTRVPLPEIAQQLRVDAVLEGSVKVLPQEIRVGIRLVDASIDRPVWAETYNRPLEDASAICEQIAEAIARRTQANYTHRQHSVALQRLSVVQEAYEAYLKGRYFWSRRTEADLNKSLRYFSEALEYEACYPAALTGLADAYILLGILGLRSPHDVYPQARRAAEKALQLNPALADAHKSLAAVRNHYDWDWRAAEVEFQRAIALDPGSSVAHQWYAAALLFTGQHDEAVAEARRARDLDPLSPSLTAFVGLIYMKLRKFNEAIEACHAAIELDPSHPFGHWILARSLDARGDVQQALNAAQIAANVSRGDPLYTTHLGYALARAGQIEGARAFVRTLQEETQTRYVSPYDVAMIYVGLREKDMAFEWLHRALEERAVRMCELLDPAFDEIRSDPRYESLVRQIGLAT